LEDVKLLVVLLLGTSSVFTVTENDGNLQPDNEAVTFLAYVQQPTISCLPVNYIRCLHHHITSCF